MSRRLSFRSCVSLGTPRMPFEYLDQIMTSVLLSPDDFALFPFIERNPIKTNFYQQGERRRYANIRGASGWKENTV